MTRNITSTRLERVFTTPVARAFVARVMQRTGASEAAARKVYLDYLRKQEATARQRPRAAA